MPVAHAAFDDAVNVVLGPSVLLDIKGEFRTFSPRTRLPLRSSRIRTCAKQMGDAVKQGKIKYREEMIAGLEQAPAACVGLLNGEAFGKRVVKLSD